MKLFVSCLLLVVLLPAYGQWSGDPTVNNPVCTATGQQYDPKIVSDGAGGTIITWEDSRSGTFDIYAQRINASGVVQWTTDGVAICTASDAQYDPVITSDGANGAIITWYDYRNGSANSDIYSQRISAAGVVQWAADGVAICTETNFQFSPQLIGDGANGAIITWGDQRSVTSSSDIYAQRINASGAVQWTANGVAICTATGVQADPQLIGDGADGAIVAWGDNRTAMNNYDIYPHRIINESAGGGYSKIYAQRINASGAVHWTTNGVAICTAPQIRQAPEIIGDGAGGAILTWEDFRSGTNNDIYASHVDQNGALPVQLASFTATVLANNRVRLDWRTISEVNNYGFFVQRRINGLLDWWIVENSFVAGHGTTNEPHDYTFTDNNAPQGNLQYKLKQVDLDGTEHFSEPINVSVLTSVADNSAPEKFELQQNYPNPFNPSTRIRFQIPEVRGQISEVRGQKSEVGRVTLKVFDVLGREVATLVNENLNAGSYEASFDATGFTSGVYFYKLQSGSFIETKRMLLLK